MSFVRFLVFISTLMVVGCVTQRYSYNMEHAHISPDVQIPQSELEQIVLTITRATPNPIVCITKSVAMYPGGITVFTDFEHEPQRFMDYDMQRKSDGLWHIMSRGESSIIACP